MYPYFVRRHVLYSSVSFTSRCFFSRTRRRIAHHYIKNKKIKKGLKKTRKQEKQKKQNRGWGWGWEYQLCTGVLRAAPTTSNPRATTSWDPLHQPFPKTWYYLESLRGSYWCLGRPPQRHKHSCVSIATMPLESPRNWSPFFWVLGTCNSDALHQFWNTSFVLSGARGSKPTLIRTFVQVSPAKTQDTRICWIVSSCWSQRGHL